MLLKIHHLVAVAIAALTSLSVPALAQADPAEVVRHAVAGMSTVTTNTIDSIAERTTSGVQLIQRLDVNGASDRQIAVAGQEISESIASRADRGARTINNIGARAAQILRILDAERIYFQALNAARDEGTDAVRQAQRRATNAIQTAVRNAIDD